MNKIILFALCLLSTSLVNANDDLTILHSGIAYDEAKKVLIAKGWVPSKNKNINNSSLYALEIYEQGLVEVVDCISMELDACRFRFVKQNKVLEVKTVTRRLTVDSYKIMKK